MMTFDCSVKIPWIKAHADLAVGLFNNDCLWNSPSLLVFPLCGAHQAFTYAPVLFPVCPSLILGFSEVNVLQERHRDQHWCDARHDLINQVHQRHGYTLACSLGHLN